MNHFPPSNQTGQEQQLTAEAAVTIVIPTAGEPSRIASLSRAIDSVKKRAQRPVIPLVLLNGQKFDRDLYASLEKRRDIRFHYAEEPSLPNALFVGRTLVDTQYFGFLDDDDIYLENAILRRVASLEADSSLDAVVTNGIIRHSDGRQINYLSDLREIRKDPLLSVVKANWLASCGGMFRTNTVDESLFSNLPKYFEWTTVAFRLSITKKKVQLIDDLTFVVQETPNSLWKSPSVKEEQMQFVSNLLALPLPSTVRNELRKK